MSAVDRLVQYVQVDTQSDPNSPTCPSTAKQLDLARILKKELETMGASDVRLSEQGYVYACIPSNVAHPCPSVGFIAHMDTAPDYSGTGVKPRIIQDYDGKDIVLSDKCVLSIQDFPEMTKLKGKSLVVTDGSTLLGADDKAGIAAIMEAASIYLSNPSIPHGKICIGFTPDEEIGRGADQFDVPGFGADFAFTMDGGKTNEVCDETFNAASCKVTIHGLAVHPGGAKDKMINALNVAMEFHGLLPEQARPEHTEKREGYNHLEHLQGDVAEAHMDYIIRNHDAAQLEMQKDLFRVACQYLNAKYHRTVCEIELSDTYRNMKEELDRHPEVTRIARQAVESLGYTPVTESARGGTDGCTLTYMGLPCPNLGTGGRNAHGRYECCVVEELNEATQLIQTIVSLTEKGAL